MTSARAYQWVLSAYVLLLVAWTWYGVSGHGAGQVASGLLLPEEESRAAVVTRGGATEGLGLGSTVRREYRRSRRLLYEASWLTLVSPRGAGTAVKFGYLFPTLLNQDKVRGVVSTLASLDSLGDTGRVAVCVPRAVEVDGRGTSQL